MSEAPTTAEPAEKLPFVRGVKLAAMQAHRLGTISMAGVTLAQQIAKQADDAKFVGAEGALMFARVARAVRQTIAMERYLGAHFDELSDEQLGKLQAISGIGTHLVERLKQQTVVRNWFGGFDALMLTRLTVATERTMVMERRIDGEYALSHAERSAAQKRHAAEARRLRRQRQKQAAAAPAEVQIPGPVGPKALSAIVAVLAAALGQHEGDKAAAGPDDVAAQCDAGLAPEGFAPVSVEAEIGGRSLGEVAAEACRVIGITPEPGLFSAADEAADAVAAPPGGTEPRVVQAPAGLGGAGSSAGSETNGDPPIVSSREFGHDPPSG